MFFYKTNLYSSRSCFHGYIRVCLTILLDILNFWPAVNLPGLRDLEGFAPPQLKNVQYNGV